MRASAPISLADFVWSQELAMSVDGRTHRYVDRFAHPRHADTDLRSHKRNRSNMVAATVCDRIHQEKEGAGRQDEPSAMRHGMPAPVAGMVPRRVRITGHRSRS